MINYIEIILYIISGVLIFSGMVMVVMVDSMTGAFILVILGGIILAGLAEAHRRRDEEE